jgi:hypothetical protein
VGYTVWHRHLKELIVELITLNIKCFCTFFESLCVLYRPNSGFKPYSSF